MQPAEYKASFRSKLRALKKRVGTEPAVAEAQSETALQEISPATKFTENRLLPVRSTGLKVLENFERSQFLWTLALASLPVDCLIVLSGLQIALPPQTQMNLQIAALALLVISAAFLLREPLITALDKLQSFQYSITKLSIKHSKIIFLVIAAATAFEIILRFGRFGVLALAAAAFVSFKAVRAIRANFKDQKQKFEAFERDKLLLVEKMDRQLFLISLLPIFTARLASLAAALVALPSHDIYVWLPFGAVSLVLLFTFMPQREDFIVRCSRCSRWTSRSLQGKGQCPICAREEFQIKEHGVTNDLLERKKENKSGYAARLRSLSQSLTRAKTDSFNDGLAPGSSMSKMMARSKSYDMASGLSGKFLPRISKG
jgi:hypothetical protein